jgi:transposase InsO family protein
VYTKFFVHSYFGFRFVFRKHNPIPKVVKKGKKPPKSGTDYAGRHQQFCGVFNNYNFNLVPMRLRSDNGTQFEAGLFQAALKCWIVVWGNSTPHYSQSNGHAEAAVKTVKELVLKLAPSGDLSSEEFLAGVRAGNQIVTGSNCIRPSAPVNGAARPSIFLLQSMERSHGRAGASGGSRCEHKIPL